MLIVSKKSLETLLRLVLRKALPTMFWPGMATEVFKPMRFISAAPARLAPRTPVKCWTRLQQVFGKIGRKCGHDMRVGAADFGHEREADQVVHIKAGIGVAKCGEGAQHQSGFDEQNEREGSLQGEQRTAERARSAGRSTAAQRVLRHGARCKPCGNGTEEDAEQQRQSEGDERDGEIWCKRDGVCVRPERQQPDEEGRAKEGNGETTAAASEAKSSRFKQRCGQQANAAGAERNADGSVALATRGACQQQATDVRAHHQQKRGESPQQERERMAEGIAQRKGALGGGHERALSLRIVRFSR